MSYIQYAESCVQIPEAERDRLLRIEKAARDYVETMERTRGIAYAGQDPNIETFAKLKASLDTTKEAE